MRTGIGLRKECFRKDEEDLGRDKGILLTTDLRYQKVGLTDQISIEWGQNDPIHLKAVDFTLADSQIYWVLLIVTGNIYIWLDDEFTVIESYNNLSNRERMG